MEWNNSTSTQDIFIKKIKTLRDPLPELWYRYLMLGKEVRSSLAFFSPRPGIPIRTSRISLSRRRLRDRSPSDLHKYKVKTRRQNQLLTLRLTKMIGLIIPKNEKIRHKQKIIKAYNYEKWKNQRQQKMILFLFKKTNNLKGFFILLASYSFWSSWGIWTEMKTVDCNNMKLL